MKAYAWEKWGMTWLVLAVLAAAFIIVASGCSAAKVRNDYQYQGPQTESAGAGYEKHTSLTVTSPPAAPAPEVKAAPSAPKEARCKMSFKKIDKDTIQVTLKEGK
jgi:hypothetical protein